MQTTGFCSEIKTGCRRRVAYHPGAIGAGLAGLARISTVAILVLIAGALSGCVNAQIAAARTDLTRGNYAAAHERFVAASHSAKLSDREQRELADGLCLTEFKIGSPTYPLAAVARTCADAASRPQSSSAPIVAKIDSAERAATDAEVASALKAGDIAGAQNAVVRYQLFPGADQSAIPGWSKRIWAAIDRQESRSAKNRSRHFVPAIAAVSRRYPAMRAMNDSAFKRWVMNNATVSRSPLVNGIELQDGALRLQVASGSLPEIALNLDRFVRINDAMVARCRCEGRTNIAVEGSGLPAYLLRLDPETRRSEVLIMPQPH